MPQLGDRVHAIDIGRDSRGFVQWVKCPDCGMERWIHDRKQRGFPIPENSYKVCPTCRLKEWLQTRNYKGENSPTWKGGRLKRGTGYIGILKHGHYRANKSGYVWEHILVWEETHKRKLPKGYLIHHINGIKDDNRPTNLLAMLRKGHSPTLFVKGVQKRLREVEAQLAQQNLWQCQVKAG